MFAVWQNSVARTMRMASVLALLAVTLITPVSMFAGKKKEAAKPKEVPPLLQLDYSKIVWPNPPAITRVKYLDFFAAEKVPEERPKQKNGWMDRLSGVATGETAASKPLFQLAQPYGMVVDSKDRLYVADQKVGAIFIFNTETKDVELIKNGTHARFKLISGLAIDDTDRLFVSDSVAKHVLVLDPKQHHPEAVISEAIVSPAGLAIDTENRFLYVADTELDQVLVYNADEPFNLIRKIGTAGKKHELTELGQFSRPTNVAVDNEGNLYVSDTFNDRVEIFDADGNFVSTFGKAGDGPGYFARPKGIAIDNDGHVWVADTVQDRVQVFTREGQLLLWMGGHGMLPGQFDAVQGLTIDKKNRVFTSEMYPGRVQMFRYVTNDEALAEKKRRDEGAQKKSAGAQRVKPAEAPARNDAAQETPPAQTAK
jgi:sugar lactone lactonase YvrE